MAMTVGAIALMVLETEPVRPTAHPLEVVGPPPAGAGKVVYDTRVPLQAILWRNVVIHASPARSDRLARGCHFVIDPASSGDARIAATEYWRSQRAGTHIGRPWQDSSIGICLIGDFSRRPPTRRQFDALVELVHLLQGTCNISADHVYLHSDLVARSASPGPAFPAEELSARLLRPTR